MFCVLCIWLCGFSIFVSFLSNLGNNQLYVHIVCFTTVLVPTDNGIKYVYGMLQVMEAIAQYSLLYINFAKSEIPKGLSARATWTTYWWQYCQPALVWHCNHGEGGGCRILPLHFIVRLTTALSKGSRNMAHCLCWWSDIHQS